MVKQSGVHHSDLRSDMTRTTMCFRLSMVHTKFHAASTALYLVYAVELCVALVKLAFSDFTIWYFCLSCFLAIPGVDMDVPSLIMISPCIRIDARLANRADNYVLI